MGKAHAVELITAASVKINLKVGSVLVLCCWPCERAGEQKSRNAGSVAATN